MTQLAFDLECAHCRHVAHDGVCSECCAESDPDCQCSPCVS